MGAGMRFGITRFLALDLIEMLAGVERRSAELLAGEIRRGKILRIRHRRQRRSLQRGGRVVKIRRIWIGGGCGLRRRRCTAIFGKWIVLPDQPRQFGQRIAARGGGRVRRRAARDAVTRTIRWSLGLVVRHSIPGVLGSAPRPSDRGPTVRRTGFIAFRRAPRPQAAPAPKREW